MTQPNDDLFACGYAEPCSSATVCDVVGVDDLIILGVVVAASIAASQISAGEQEGAANDRLDAQQKNQMRQMAITNARNRGARAAAESGFRSKTEELEPWAQKLSIQNNFDFAKQDVARQADMQRTQGWINGGAQLATGIAGQALRPASSAAAPGAGSLSNTFDSTGTGIADRAGGYDLTPPSAGVQTPQIHASDVPTASIAASQPGGFQLQPDDYQLLQGGGVYSQGPYADDPYGTGIGIQSPRSRYGFSL